ncbi:hypothetical protein TVAG_160320 [Trichomonas vaginalis G3]|uniref:Uncharacterized protein n=1 Tax=Trichomonas vaginalis (strain ATCC PRA-98 / G3) TaxID=412133 RepID=A2DUX4_TRIV3|nr:hypothetical protein TVAGG3_0259070 [Trichomonas vaginalis G3]EAY15859.1 hypothetical protein TVAG_160320 [Trichomonas vaginalis G3]KAI5524972.1 hypothetical protein TVAGG3_0259070 [Trichomonas vaginalis G3]|eukprot:XP_001328082.1 hypothetical protein [Trichomonas vaginalis G3]
MLPLLAYRTAYNADDDNFWLPIPTKLGLLRIGIDKNEAEDDDNWYVGFSYHSPWGKFSIGYHSNDEEDDDNWYVGFSYHSPWGKFSIGYHSNDDEDDENFRLWADLATAIGRFGFEYHNAAEEDDNFIIPQIYFNPFKKIEEYMKLHYPNEDRKVAAKKPIRINKALLKRWFEKYGYRAFPRLYKKGVAPKKNVLGIIAANPIYRQYYNWNRFLQGVKQRALAK